MLRQCLVVTALALGIAPGAGAQTVQNVLAEAGVLGRWANDCSRPAGGGNIHTIYAVEASGEVTVTYSHGPGTTPTVNAIQSARPEGPGRVAYHQRNRDGGAELDIVLMVTATHIRVWTSRRSTGASLVENGKFTSDGVDSPLQARCR